MSTSVDAGAHPMNLLEQAGRTGMEKATEALSALAGKTIVSSVQRVRVIPFEEVPLLLGDPEQVIFAVQLKISGDITGYFIMVFFFEDALRLINTLTCGNCQGFDDLGELEISAISEVGNILSSSYLHAIEDYTGLQVMPEPPFTAVDMAAGVLTSALAPLAEAGYEIISLEARFEEAGANTGGQMMLLPSAESLPRLLHAVGMQK
jgi:chemotaxis protein CheC